MEQVIIRNPKILSRDNTSLLLIDIQIKILDVMQNPKMVINNSLKLIKGFKVLNIPIFYTEQYPKGLGSTAPQLQEGLKGLSAIQKSCFSCLGAPNFFKRLRDNKVNQIVVAGIETHVCVQQTVLDLLANGFQANVAADAVSSRYENDYKFALDRMRANGAEVTTTEAILFELLKYCGTEDFKTIAKIIR